MRAHINDPNETDNTRDTSTGERSTEATAAALRTRAAGGPDAVSRVGLLYLQRAAGNRAVIELLDRRKESAVEKTLSVQRRASNEAIRMLVESRTIQRIPGPPSYHGVTGGLDRSKVQIDEVSDIVVETSSGAPTFPTQNVKPKMNDASIVHLTWELYDPNDVTQGGNFSTIPGGPDSTTKAFPLSPVNFSQPVRQGRHLLRCTGLNAKHEPVAYADRTFFVWTSKPVTSLDLAELDAIKKDPSKAEFGTLGAAHARSWLLEHQKAVAASGTGKFMGAQVAGTAPTGVTKEDCTTYVLKVLEQTFKDKGQAAEWKAVFDEAKKTSGANFKGTELLTALQTKAGWKAVFWSPDPRNPADSTSEHPAAYKKVKSEGTYYGVAVDKSKSVVDYRRTQPTAKEEMSNLDHLRMVPLGVIAARGGKHMTLLLSGQVYEVHWDRSATDPNVIEATPLEKWAWQSGVVVMPAADFAKAWRPRPSHVRPRVPQRPQRVGP